MMMIIIKSNNNDDLMNSDNHDDDDDCDVFFLSMNPVHSICTYQLPYYIDRSGASTMPSYQ